MVLLHRISLSIPSSAVSVDQARVRVAMVKSVAAMAVRMAQPACKVFTQTTPMLEATARTESIMINVLNNELSESCQKTFFRTRANVIPKRAPARIKKIKLPSWPKRSA